MDWRGWAWRKKSSAKTKHIPDSVTESSNLTAVDKENQDNSNKEPTYVQLSQDRYAHLSEMENQLKLITEHLSTARSELSTKDTLIKQHTKVAEEAVSGWEKAEAEALTLKTQLESVSLSKLTAEDQVAHLDDTLKECMKQIRNVKEESEQKLHDVVLANSRQLEQVELEFEIKINEFEEELLRATAENDALSRSLQERSETLMKISEEKAQADDDIEVLKKDRDSSERELNSMKYEVHIISKELEIRNEEKNMSVRSAEVANKHHLEDVKKITKLEAECQKLRGLVRKKLPGPAALSQMKSEVESLGRDYGESRVRRSPAKSSSPYILSAPDYSFENIHQFQKENEFLNARLLETELETKMLKAALSKRNSELQASRNMFAKTASKVRSLEGHVLVLKQQRTPSKSTIDIPVEGFLSQNESNPPSMASVSEDGNDEVTSCTEGVSSATALISNLSNLKNDKDADKFSKDGSSSNLELMDDFLEMEKLACLSTESTGSFSVLGGGIIDKIGPANSSPKDINSHKEEHSDQQSSAYPISFDEEQSTRKLVSYQNNVSLSKFQSRISSIFESEGKENTNMSKLLEKVKSLVHELEEELPHPKGDDTCIQKNCHEDLTITKCIERKTVLDDDLKKAINQIYDFVELFVRSSDPDLLGKVRELSSVVNKVMSCELCVDEFIVTLSAIFSESSELGTRIFGDKGGEIESSSSDCMDKVNSLENKVNRHESGKGRFSGSSFDGEIHQGRSGPDVEMKGSLVSYSHEEFEQLKLEKDNLANELAKCTESLEQAKSRLIETEQHLQDRESQFTGSQKYNSLAETQLKCMTESYRSLESRSNELETEISLLRSKTETLEMEVKNEISAHQEDLAKYKDLQEQMERNVKGPMSSETNADAKTKQEMEIATAAEKLAECQETIFLLGKQFKSLHSRPNTVPASPNVPFRVNKDFSEDVLSTSDSNLQLLKEWPGTTNISGVQRAGGESPFEAYGHYIPSDTESVPIPKSPTTPKFQKPRSSKSSPSSNQSNEKHGRGFSRFFSKGKSDH